MKKSSSSGSSSGSSLQLGTLTVPHWVDDKVRPWCYLCFKNFSKITLTLRHHCRRCGEVICGKCSSNKVLLTEFLPTSWPNLKEGETIPQDFEGEPYTNPLRVCNKCFEERKNSSALTGSESFKNEVLLLQSVVKMIIARQEFLEKKRKIVQLQAFLKGAVAVKQSKLLLKEARRRKMVAAELLATERTYVDCLMIINEAFQVPMVSNRIITTEQQSSLFGNFIEVLAFHMELLDLLEQRIDKDRWQPNAPVGDVFLKMIPSFEKVYKVYIVNYDKNIDMHNKLTESNANYAKFCQQAKSNPRCKMLELPDLMITGVQRLPRYELLLSTLLKHTSKQYCDDYETIVKAIASLKELIVRVNENKRQAESSERIKEIKSKVRRKNKGESVVKSSRLLVKEGLLFEIIEEKSKEKSSPKSIPKFSNSSSSYSTSSSIYPSDKKKKEVYAFLFNDVIMCSKQTFTRKNLVEHTVKYDHTINVLLTKATLSYQNQKMGSTGENDLCFTIVEASGTSYTFAAPNKMDFQLWITAIKTAIAESSKET